VVCYKVPGRPDLNLGREARNDCEGIAESGREEPEGAQSSSELIYFIAGLKFSLASCLYSKQKSRDKEYKKKLV